jgi:hypothetical protein
MVSSKFSGTLARQPEKLGNRPLPLLKESISFTVRAHRYFLNAAAFQWPKAKVTLA